MAGDWIKIEHATIDKPEIIAMADLLEKSPDEVFGMCFRVWRWFDANSIDGNAGSNAGSVTGNALMALVNRLAGDVRFAACMKKVGWLGDNGVPNFDYHLGESAKKRAVNARRQAKHRDAKSNADSVTNPLPEKRREENKETPIASRDSRAPQVAWSEAGFQIPESVQAGFKTAYPAIDLAAEVAKAHAWVLANPKNRKSNWGRFLNGWLGKAQDRAPRVQADAADWRKDPRFAGAV